VRAQQSRGRMPVSVPRRLQRLAGRDLPLVAFAVTFGFTCYIGALLLMFGPAAVRAQYIASTGADIRPLTERDVVTNLILLNAAPALLLVGWGIGQRVFRLSANALHSRAATASSRRWALVALVFCLIVETGRLAMNGSLSQLGAWNNYAALVAAREQVLNGLWFGDFVLIYMVIPLLIAFLVAELLSGQWLRGWRANVLLAGLLLSLLAINVAIFQKRTLIEALLLIGFVTFFRLRYGPSQGVRFGVIRGGAVAVATVATVYLVGLLLPLLRGTPYTGANHETPKVRQGDYFSTGFEQGASGWTTATGNFLVGGGRYYMAPGVSGIGLQVWGQPGQGVAYPTGLVAPGGGDWLLTAWLRSDVPERTIVSLGVPGLDAASHSVRTGRAWALQSVCWHPVQRSPRLAIAFALTRDSRLTVDDVRLQSVQTGSCQDFKVVAGRLGDSRPTRPSVPPIDFVAPDSSFNRPTVTPTGAVVTFPDPTVPTTESATSIKVLSPVVGILTRTAGPAISYPTLYPRVFPYEPIDTGLDLLGLGRAADDNVTSWKGLFPLTPGGANAVPFMFALYAQGGITVALVGALILGALWWALWLVSHLHEDLLIYRPIWLGLVVLFGVSLAGDSLRDALLASYGIAWPLGGLVSVAVTRRAWRHFRERSRSVIPRNVSTGH
jgi:hypothetical protein